MAMALKGSDILHEGIQNWKLRLLLSALLCIMGRAGLISMALGELKELTVMDKTFASIAVFMAGTPVYLIAGNLNPGKVDQ
jgi:hypothetical protein